MDGGGAIDEEEFSMMLRVMGCEISGEQVKKAIADAKEGFAAWVKMADAENLAKCKRVWEEYDDDNSGTMDLREINNVIKALQDMGFSPSPMSAADMADGELDFDEFSVHTHLCCTAPTATACALTGLHATCRVGLVSEAGGSP